MTSKEETTCRWKAPEFEIQDYFCEKFYLIEEELHWIDWYNYSKARGKMSPGTQTFSTKYIINWLPTGSRMELMGGLVTTCIHCGYYEDGAHLLLCKHRSETASELLEKYDAFLTEAKTEPTLQRVIMHYAAKYFSQQKSWKKSRSSIYDDAIKEQERIGWTSFTKGIWSEQWGKKQLEYEQKKKMKRTNWTRNNIVWWTEEGKKAWTERNHKIHEQDNNVNEKTGRSNRTST